MDNTSPIVLITSPSNNSTFNINTDFTISIVVQDNSKIKLNELYINGKLESNFNDNIKYNTQTDIGNHTILVKSYDEFDNVGISDIVNFTVSNLNVTDVSGTITNNLNVPISDADIYIDDKLVANSNKDGDYSIHDIEFGKHTMKIVKNSLYEVYESDENISKNTSAIDINLISVEIPKAYNLKFTDGNYSGVLNWSHDNSFNEIISGFNVYYRVWYFSRDAREIFNNNHNLKFSAWVKYNDSPIESNNLELSLEEYNVYYEFYVLPINIDDIETNIGQYVKESDKVLSVYRGNNKLLGEFELSSSYGPVEMPTLNQYEELSLMSSFLYKEGFNFFEPSDWTVQISTNGGVSWQTLLNNGIDTVFGNSVPSYGGGYTKKINLNQYAGKTVHFRTSPSTYGSPSMEITHWIAGLNY